MVFLKLSKDRSGVALFMVLAAMSVLAILVTEFTYIAQVSQMIAFGGLHQTQAHYLAKSGLKISLLRLKAYQQVKSIVNSMGGAGGVGAVPKSVIDKIWSFPFIYPIPTGLPGMGSAEKESIEKFQKSSNLEGSFSATIESESSRYNVNLLVPNFIPAMTKSQTSDTGSGTGTGTQGQQSQSQAQNPAQTQEQGFNSADAQKSLYDYLSQVLNQKFEKDTDFASLHRDFKLEDFMDALVASVDRTYERRTSNSLDKVQIARTPFFHISQLHTVPIMEDEIYDLFAPTLTAHGGRGININTMAEPVLRALVPEMTKDEVNEFFKYRDSLETGEHQFKTDQEFYEYLQKNVNAYRNDANAINTLKTSFQKRNIDLVQDETLFKITVRATVNNAVKTIEAWVTLGSSSSGSSSGAINPNTSDPTAGAQVDPNAQTTTPASSQKDSGLKITYMRIL